MGTKKVTYKGKEYEVDEKYKYIATSSDGSIFVSIKEPKLAFLGDYFRTTPCMKVIEWSDWEDSAQEI